MSKELLFNDLVIRRLLRMEDSNLTSESFSQSLKLNDSLLKEYGEDNTPFDSVNITDRHVKIFESYLTKRVLNKYLNVSRSYDEDEEKLDNYIELASSSKLIKQMISFISNSLKELDEEPFDVHKVAKRKLHVIDNSHLDSNRNKMINSRDNVKTKLLSTYNQWNHYDSSIILNLKKLQDEKDRNPSNLSNIKKFNDLLFKMITSGSYTRYLSPNYPKGHTDRRELSSKEEGLRSENKGLDLNEEEIDQIVLNKYNNIHFNTSKQLNLKNKKNLKDILIDKLATSKHNLELLKRANNDEIIEIGVTESNAKTSGVDEIIDLFNKSYSIEVLYNE